MLYEFAHHSRPAASKLRGDIERDCPETFEPSVLKVDSRPVLLGRKYARAHTLCQNRAERAYIGRRLAEVNEKE